MRKNALVLLLTFAVFSGVLYYFAQNKYIERLAEKSGELFFGARVEFDDMYIKLFNLQCGWRRLQVADKIHPMKNLIETGEANFALEFLPLFWGKIIISELKLLDVRSGTARLKDGSLPQTVDDDAAQKGAFAKTKSAIKARMESLPALDFSQLRQKLDIDSLVQADKLQSISAYESLIGELDSMRTATTAQLNERKYADRVRTLKNEIAAVQIEKTRDPVKIKKTLQQLAKIKNTLETLQANVQNDKSSLMGLKLNAQKRYANAQRQLQADIVRVKKMARLKELETTDIGLLLFGAPFIKNAKSVMRYIVLARRYMPAAAILFEAQKEPEPQRFAGQDIHFRFYRKFPNFLVRKIILSASTGADNLPQQHISGTILGLTNEPAVFGRPTQFALKINKSMDEIFSLRAVFDHLGEITADSIWLEASAVKPGTFSLQERINFPTKISAKSGSFALTGFFTGASMKLNLQGQAQSVQFDYAEVKKNQIGKTIKEVLDGIQKLTIDAMIAEKGGTQVLRINSNIDKALTRRLRLILGEKIKKARQQLENRVRKSANNSGEKARVTLDQLTLKFEHQINEINNSIETQKKKLSEKEAVLKTRLAAETAKMKRAAEQQKGQLEKEVKKKLKDLFKKP